MALPNNEWPSEHTAQVKRLHADGISYGLIHKEMPQYTRSAIIGKCARLGLPSRRDKAPTERKPQSGGTNGGVRRCIADSLATPLLDDIALPEAQKVALLELTETTCRWPLGDPDKPDFAFCGADALSGAPYCAHHCRVAFQPGSALRRRVGV